MAMEMNTEVIVSCAVTGGGDTVDKHPAIPVTPKEIAAAAIEAAKAGAAIAHCHVRNPETGKDARDYDLFREVTERIRESDTDVLINLTGGGGGTFIPGDDDPRAPQEGSSLVTPAERVAHAVGLKPDITSLDCGTMNFGDHHVYVGTLKTMREMASRIQAAGVKPEIEVFDVGQIMLARQLIDDGLIDGPPMFQLCLGIGHSAPTETQTMLAMRDLLPDDAVWASFGISRMQMPMVAKSVLLGGNVRVGLEDNLYLERGVFASNGQLVEKAVGIIERLGARVLSPDEARVKLGLPARS